MIPRAILDLGQLNDNEFLAAVAEGMRLSLQNALNLWQDALHLRAGGRAQGFQIMKLLVEEEAAKAHILMDAARCPRLPQERFNRQLKYFTDHLARGLYTEYYQWRFMDLREAVTYLDRERCAFYLDGPEGIDWIFRNAIDQRREEAIYVDYIAIRDHFQESHQWHAPNPEHLEMYLGDVIPPILRIANLLHECELMSPDAVSVIARVWRNAPAPETLAPQQIADLNHQTLMELVGQGLLVTVSDERGQELIQQWRAPLYPLDLRKREVKPAELQGIQEQWGSNCY